MESKKRTVGIKKLFYHAVRRSPTRFQVTILLTNSSQQYHSALVLLYRPFVNYKSVGAFGSWHDPLTSLFERGVCITQAFIQSAHRYSIRQSFITALQHAGAAISAFITILVYVKDRKKRYYAMRYLLFMSRILEELSHTYRHALHMHRLVLEMSQQKEWFNEYQNLDEEFKHDCEDLQHFTVDGYNSSTENTEPKPMKKRRKVGSPNLPSIDDGVIDDSASSDTFRTTWPSGQMSESFLAGSFDISTEGWENLPVLPLSLETRGYDFSFEYSTP